MASPLTSSAQSTIDHPTTTTPPLPDWAIEMQKNLRELIQRINLIELQAENDVVSQILAIVGINNRCILNVHFLTRDVVSLLVHKTYKQEIVDILIKGKIQLITFNPTDPKVICDSIHLNKSDEEKSALVTSIYHNRITRLCKNIQPKHLDISIIRHFNTVEGHFNIPDSVLNEFFNKTDSSIHPSATIHFITILFFSHTTNGC
ncbi:unnamed protein product [Cunninghamella blakesleeana]